MRYHLGYKHSSAKPLPDASQIVFEEDGGYKIARLPFYLDKLSRLERHALRWAEKQRISRVMHVERDGNIVKITCNDGTEHEFRFLDGEQSLENGNIEIREVKV